MHRFARPVTIRWSRGMQTVGDVEGAIEAMRDWVKWPIPPRLDEAYPICYGAIADPPTSTVEEAREAFVRAAREAGVLRE